MRISKDGLDLIKEFEELRLKAYICPAGKPTIGYGHTNNVSINDVRNGRTVTEQVADQLLLEDVSGAEEAVEKGVDVALTQSQFDALVSFTFNVGNTAFLKSTLLSKLNHGDYLGAANQFLRWNKSNGQVLKGLTRRREAERRLFLKDF